MSATTATAAGALAASSASILVAAVWVPAPWTSRLAAVAVALALAAGAREVGRDDVLGWTVAVGASAITLLVVVMPSVLGLTSTAASRPGALSAMLAGCSAVSLVAATGRALGRHGPWSGDHG